MPWWRRWFRGVALEELTRNLCDEKKANGPAPDRLVRETGPHPGSGAAVPAHRCSGIRCCARYGKNPARREDLENSGAPPRKPRLFLENAGGSGDCGPLPGMWCARLLLTRSDPYGKETAGYGGAVKN